MIYVMPYRAMALHGGELARRLVDRLYAATTTKETGTTEISPIPCDIPCDTL